MTDSNNQWEKLTLGHIPSGDPVIWDISLHAHGVTHKHEYENQDLLQRTIFFHCVMHSDNWKIMGLNFDPNNGEMKHFENYPETTLGVASSLKDIAALLESAQTILQDRYDEMVRIGARTYKEIIIDLETGAFLPAIMIFIDNAYDVLPDELKSLPAEERDIRFGIAQNIARLARIGRSAGVHILVGHTGVSQPQRRFLPREDVDFVLRPSVKNPSMTDLDGVEFSVEDVSYEDFDASFSKNLHMTNSLNRLVQFM